MTHRARAAALFATLSLVAWAASAQGQGQLKKVQQPQPEETNAQLQRVPAQPKAAEAVEIQRKPSAGLKVQPLNPGRSDGPILLRDPHGESFEQRLASMEQVQTQLKQTFADFERQHRKTLQVARRIASKYDQCYEKIYTQGSFTQAERDAACSSADSQDTCLAKLLRHCIGSDADEFEQALLALREKSDDVASLIAPYSRGRTAELR